MRRGDRERRRILATVLFTDIVGSTELAAKLGDRRWHEVIKSHHRIVRAGLKRFHGREVDTAGDGFFATFEQPSDAIECALAIQRDLQRLGIEIRAGVHMGEVESTGEKVSGIAVHVGARVMSKAGPSEVLISSTVRDLLTGADMRFEDRGFQELKGVEAQVHLYAVAGEHAEDGGEPSPFGPGEPQQDQRRRNLVPILILGTAVVIAIAALAIVMASGDDDGTFTPAANTVAIVDPDSGELSGGVVVGTSPEAIVFDGELLWVANFNDQTIQSIDPETGVAGPAQGAGNPTGLAVGGDYIWVANGLSTTILKIDPRESNKKESIDLADVTDRPDAHPTDIAYGEDSLWVADASNAIVYRIDPDDHVLLEEVLFPEGSDPTDIEVGEGSVWVTIPTQRSVARIDPSTNEVASEISLSDEPRAVTVGEGAAWVTLPASDSVVRIDAQTSRAVTIAGVGDSPQGLDVGSGKIWVADSADSSVSWIDASSLEVGGSAPLAAIPWDVACTPDGVWVTIRD